MEEAIDPACVVFQRMDLALAFLRRLDLAMAIPLMSSPRAMNSLVVHPGGADPSAAEAEGPRRATMTTSMM